MVFKNFTPEDYHAKPVQPTLQQEGQIIPYIGSSKPHNPTRNEGKVERVPTIDDELLCYNAEAGIVLVRIKQNDRVFDSFVKMPFTKGATERETGRTMLILGDYAHHGEAMQGQFGIAQEPYTDTKKGFGNTIRWINVGDTKTGFIGMDYRPSAATNQGVARNQTDVKYLANMLLQFGYDPKKKLFLLEPPHIKESGDGKTLRKHKGLETLLDWSKLK